MLQRESRIYIAFALASISVALYTGFLAFEAHARFGNSGTFAVCATLVGILTAVATLFIRLAFIFTFRSIESILPDPQGYKLVQNRGDGQVLIRTTEMKHIRTIGGQFAADESIGQFSVFKSGGRVWVSRQITFQSAAAKQREA